MANYNVRSGDIDVVIEAKNHKMAIILAIDKLNPSSLGVLVACKKEEDDDDDEVYFSTISVLEDMGFIPTNIKQNK
jgi:hypothetical protein